MRWNGIDVAFIPSLIHRGSKRVCLELFSWVGEGVGGWGEEVIGGCVIIIFIIVVGSGGVLVGTQMRTPMVVAAVFQRWTVIMERRGDA